MSDDYTAAGPTDRGEGAGRLVHDSGSAAPSPHRDPAASAPLSELVAVNIAGDIEAVADELDAEFDFVPTDACCRLQDAAARLRRIAAGIREGQS